MPLTTQLAPQPEVVSLFSHLVPGAPIDVGAVSFVPLLLDGDGPDADLLEEALAGGRAVLTEASEGGHVNEVLLHHSGDKLLLLLDGEEIVGAKQNRILNASFLVPPGKEVLLPVSCVEAGRWRYQSSSFASAARTVSPSVRMEKLRRVSRSVAAGEGYDAEQGAVWADVDGYLARAGVTSATSAFDDGARAQAARVDDEIERLAPIAGQVGVAVVHGGRLVGMDVFGSSALFARAWRKVARGLLAEIYEPSRSRSKPTAVVKRALKAVEKLASTRHAAPGCGETLHGDDARFTLGAIAFGGQLFHAVVAAA